MFVSIIDDVVITSGPARRSTSRHSEAVMGQLVKVRMCYMQEKTKKILSDPQMCGACLGWRLCANINCYTVKHFWKDRPESGKI